MRRVFAAGLVIATVVAVAAYFGSVGSVKRTERTDEPLKPLLPSLGTYYFQIDSEDLLRLLKEVKQMCHGDRVCERRRIRIAADRIRALGR